MNNIEQNISIPFSDGNIFVVLYSDFFKNCVSKIPCSHTHSKYEFQYISRGSCVYKFNGIEKECLEKSIVVIPPNCSHSVHPKDDDTITYTFLFEIKNKKRGDIVLESLGVSHPVCLQNCFVAKTRLLNISQCLKENSGIQNEIIRGELILLFAEISASLGICQKKNEVKADENRGEKIEEYIVRNYAEKECSSKGLAEYLHVSVRQAHRLCTFYYKTSFKNLLRGRRMETAKFLLSKGKMSVTEISHAVGYSSVASFSSSYKEYFGVSPSEDFRK